jgi:hypothetical protein
MAPPNGCRLVLLCQAVQLPPARPQASVVLGMKRVRQVRLNGRVCEFALGAGAVKWNLPSTQRVTTKLRPTHLPASFDGDRAILIREQLSQLANAGYNNPSLESLCRALEVMTVCIRLACHQLRWEL